MATAESIRMQCVLARVCAGEMPMDACRREDISQARLEAWLKRSDDHRDAWLCALDTMRERRAAAALEDAIARGTAREILRATRNLMAAICPERYGTSQDKREAAKRLEWDLSRIRRHEERSGESISFL